MHNLIFRCLCFFSCLLLLNPSSVQPLQRVINQKVVIENPVLMDEALPINLLADVTPDVKAAKQGWTFTLFIENVWSHTKVQVSMVCLLFSLLLVHFSLVARLLQFRRIRFLKPRLFARTEIFVC